MQTKVRENKIFLFLITLSIVSGICAEIPDQMRSRFIEGFRAPSYSTNFPSEQLFSIADIKRRTYSVKQSKSLRLTRSGIYSPTSEAVSSPMIQIVASTVTIDLNGQELSKEASSARCVGIEIGYDPVTLATDSTLTIDSQPQNVVIRNGTIDNFDIGIVVHKGVKSITLENVTFSRAPIAIVFMGDTGASEEIVSCVLDNVSVVGDNVEEAGVGGAIEWARTKIESSVSGAFNYGANSFMNIVNPVDGSDASVYSGIVLRRTNNMQLRNVSVNRLGYKDAEENSSVTYGIDIQNSKNIFLDEVNASSNFSPAEVVGCHIKSSSSISIKNSIFGDNQAQRVDVDTVNSSNYRRSIGLFVESTSVAILSGVTCNANTADNAGDISGYISNDSRARAYGLLWLSGAALELTDIACSHNDGHEGFACGMQFDGVESITMDNVAADYNSGTGGDIILGDDNDNSKNMGATGIFFSTSVNSLAINRMTTKSNFGSSVVGLRIMNGQAVTIDHFSSNSNNGTSFVKAMSCGGSMQSCTMQHVSLVSNVSNGGQVSGATFQDAHSIQITDAICNYNTTANNNDVVVIEFTGGADSVTLEDVQISSNIADGTGSICAFYMESGSSITFEHVQINGNIGGGDSRVVNFDVSIASLTLDDVTVNSNGLLTESPAGDMDVVYLNYPSNLLMKDVTINANSTQGDGTLRALVIDPSGNVINLNNVIVNGNSSESGIVIGFVGDGITSLIMNNCSFSNNLSENNANNVIGLSFNSPIGMSVSGLVIDGVTSAGSSYSATGLYILNGVSVNLTDITCNNVTAEGAAIGIHFDGYAKSILLKNISTNHTNSSTSTAQGIIITNVEGFVGSNIFSGQSTAAAGQDAQGIYFKTAASSVDLSHANFDGNSGGDVSGVLVENGENINFTDVTGDQNTGTGSVYGMNFIGSITALDMKDVNAGNNSSDGGLVAGMSFGQATSVSIETALINHNHTSNGEAFGLVFHDDAISISLKDINIDTTSAAGTGADAIGILFDNDSSNIMINNVSVNQTSSADSDIYGVAFFDTVTSLNMQNVFMSGGFAGGGDAFGLYVDSGSNIGLLDCNADQNSGTEDVYGMYFDGTVNSLDIIDSSCSGNVSTDNGAVYGCRVVEGVAVKIDGLAAHYNQSAGSGKGVVGIEFGSPASSISIKNIYVDNNIAGDGDATGLKIMEGNSINIDGAVCNYNSSGSNYTSRGIHAIDSLQSGHFENIRAEGNFNGRQAIGIHLENPISVEMNNILASRNTGVSRGYGIFLDGQSDGGSNVSVIAGVINNNHSTASATSMVAPDTTVTVSKHLPVNPADSVSGFQNVLEGGFGIYVYHVDSCYFGDVEASKNTGMRAGGMYVAACNDCTFEDCKTSFQQASGDYFYTANPFASLDNTALVIPSAQVATIFGGTTDTTVNLLQLTKDFLHGLRNVKYLQDVSEYDPNLVEVYNNIAEVSGAQILMRAIMAQYRSFSTAVGVQVHNSINCVFYDHIAIGNQSSNDSAMGIGISGTAEGHLITRVKCSGNEAWSSSKADSSGNIDISQVLPFWTFLETRVLSSSWSGALLSGELYDDGNTDPISGTITPAQIARHTVDAINSADQPQPIAPLLSEPHIDIDRLAITFIGSGTYPVGCLEEFGSVVGGVAAGILVGDGAVNIEVKDSDCANNKGNSGQAFGLMQDVTTSLSAKDNQFYQSTVNDLGWCSGLAEYTLQSNSVHLGNVMFANTIGNMLNSNYFIPYDPADYPTISFPVKIGYNGDIRNFANASPFDNLIIEFIAAKQSSVYIPNNMVTYWEHEDTAEGTGKEPWTGNII